MPRVTSSVTGDTAVGGCYPKLMKGNVSGSIYLLTAPKTGTVVHLGANPWRGRKAQRTGSPSKHKLGYYSTRLVEGDMTPFKGEIKLALAS